MIDKTIFAMFSFKYKNNLFICMYTLILFVSYCFVLRNTNYNVIASIADTRDYATYMYMSHIANYR